MDTVLRPALTLKDKVRMETGMGGFPVWFPPPTPLAHEETL